ncbi:cytochrome c family protein [Hyphobacterium sp. HN65]|uniref:Cytochrome c family protein n=1 Tax=Hyphobacterium lacteum TaxID=3116575 RepID=A0ABU7LNN1_9PROT|nr:cytochrome c family protein [Hyphobacterium sp. HN65]MEE2525502.1 cytochrome c family protein [Hyphobacterium sp. HN65]
MGDLFWNKIGAVIIGLVLMVMVIGVVGDIVFSEGGHDDEHASLSYPIDVESVLGGNAGSDPVEEVRVDLGTLLAAADAGAGERIFRRCVSCHNAEPGGANLQGPNLWNVVGRAVASYDGFNYSGAMSDHGGNWTYEELDHFIANPRSYISGTAMAFAGIRGDEDRANLLAYMQTLSDSPVPFPAPVVAETADAADGMVEDAMMDAAGEVDAATTEAAENLSDQMDAIEDAAQGGGAEDTPAEEGGN